MSLRPHTYTASVAPSSLGTQSFHPSGEPLPLLVHRSPNSAEQGHPAQFPENLHVPLTTTAVNVPTIVEPSTSYSVHLGIGRWLVGAVTSIATGAVDSTIGTGAGTGRGSGSGKRLDSILEDDEYDYERERKSRRKRNTRQITFQKLWRRLLRNRRYLLYTIVGICCSYVVFLQPLITAQAEEGRNKAPAHSLDSDKSDAASASASAGGRVLPWQMSRHRKAVSRLAQAAQGPPQHSTLASASGSGSNTRGNHTIEDGYLRVNPESTVHPIYQLIESARSEWDAKVNRQSKTLREAVEEYTRRYKTMPPQGFDKWWAYVRENDVQLPDEYDQIHKDLHPFRALSPRDLKARVQEAAQLHDTFVIRVQRGTVRTETLYKPEAIHDKRMQHQLELLRPIAESLPDLQVVWSVHDTARTMISHAHRMELNERIEEGEWLNVADDSGHSDQGWPATCSYSSPINARSRFNSKKVTKPEGASFLPDTSLANKRFISSHRASMDICSNPELVSLHGSLIAGRKRQVDRLTAIFSLSKTDSHSDVLGVPLEQWVDVNGVKEVPWSEKRHDRLLWRGSNTGMHYAVDTPWRGSQRTRLVKLASHKTGQGEVNTETSKEKVQVLSAHMDVSSKTATMEESSWSANMGDLNARFMDISFTGAPIQCDIADGTCGELAQEYTWGTRVNPEQALEYKYVMDVDGNAWSARFERLLASGSLVFKSTIFPEWWTDRVQPWVHYVPIQMDYSDLYDAMAFFQGESQPSTSESDSVSSSSRGESALAREIAQAGREWARTHWRKEDLIAYTFRLYLEWGRLLAPQRDSAAFVYSDDMEV
ncbi:hypothetical protein IAU59_003277 [Kwoniella sp. CBS 9459]